MAPQKGKGRTVLLFVCARVRAIEKYGTIVWVFQSDMSYDILTNTSVTGKHNVHFTQLVCDIRKTLIVKIYIAEDKIQEKVWFEKKRIVKIFSEEYIVILRKKSLSAGNVAAAGYQWLEKQPK